MKVSSYLMPKDENPGTNPKYWGRVQRYTHIIPETLFSDDPIFECNDEYVWLLSEFIKGTIDERNISRELLYELREAVTLIPQYGVVPMPEWDPLFYCIFGPKDPDKQCEMIADSSCDLLVDREGCFLSPPDRDIWTDYLYYCDSDPQSYGVYVWNIKTMELDQHVASLKPNPHSIDRACFSSKMYARTQNGHSFDVFYPMTYEFKQTIPLVHKPRTTGDPNPFLDLQLISGKDHPMVSVIDIIEDRVLYVAGVFNETGAGPSGNQGGSATGHPSWLDAHHFTVLDRINDKIRVIEVTELGNRQFGFRETQTLTLPTGIHTMDPDIPNLKLENKKFWMVHEGSSEHGLEPGIQRVDWVNGVLVLGSIFRTGSGDTDAAHHFGYNLETNEIFLPTFWSGKTYVVDADDMTLKYESIAGAGGGHVNFSYKYKLACITDHFDNVVYLIDYTDTTGLTYWKVTVAYEPDAPYLQPVDPQPPGQPKPRLIQTHTNHVKEVDGDEYFYLGTGNPGNGRLVRVNLYNVINGVGEPTTEILVGGHPEQSTS